MDRNKFSGALDTAECLLMYRPVKGVKVCSTDHTGPSVGPGPLAVIRIPDDPLSLPCTGLYDRWSNCIDD
jgi:hypothetical protein